MLGTVLDFGISENLDHLARTPEGDLRDGLPNRDRLGAVRTSSGKLDIMLDLVQRPNQPSIWLFSSETLGYIPKIFEELEEPWFAKLLPSWLRDKEVFSLPLWRWFLIFLGITLALVLAGLSSRALISLVRPLVRYTTGEEDDKLRSSLKGPIRILFLSLALRMLSEISVSLLARQFCVQVARVLAVFGFAWLTIRAIEIVSNLVKPRVLQQHGKLSVVALVNRILKIVVVFAAGILLLHGAGVNVTAMLAGLGVGGIALALAAQKTLENLFGGISIIMREAIRVGDVCNIAGQIGTIEDIGIGATRLRALDRRVVSVPNAQIYQMNLENLSMRDKFLFKHILALRRDTSPEQMRYVLSTISETLRNHPKIEVETARIQFIEFGSSSLDTEIFAYVKETDYVCFLRIQQELLLSILDIVSASGTALALPSQTTYLERDTRITSDAAEQSVAQNTGPQRQGEYPRRKQDTDSSSRTATPELPTEC